MPAPSHSRRERTGTGSRDYRNSAWAGPYQTAPLINTLETASDGHHTQEILLQHNHVGLHGDHIYHIFSICKMTFCLVSSSNQLLNVTFLILSFCYFSRKAALHLFSSLGTVIHVVFIVAFKPLRNCREVWSTAQGTKTKKHNPHNFTSRGQIMHWTFNFLCVLASKIEFDKNSQDNLNIYWNKKFTLKLHFI